MKVLPIHTKEISMLMKDYTSKGGRKHSEGNMPRPCLPPLSGGYLFALHIVAVGIDPIAADALVGCHMAIGMEVIFITAQLQPLGKDHVATLHLLLS